MALSWLVNRVMARSSFADMEVPEQESEDPIYSERRGLAGRVLERQLALPILCSARLQAV